MVWVANGENRSETCEYALTPGSAPYRALTKLRASPRPAAGKNWPSLEAVRPVPQKAAIGSAAWASTTTANARSNASPSTCQRAMRISSQNPCVVVASAILRRPTRTRRRPHRPAPRRPAGSGPRRGRTDARRASRADWSEPAGCGRHQRRREPTAAPLGCRRSGGTASVQTSPARNASRRWNNTAVSQRR